MPKRFNIRNRANASFASENFKRRSVGISNQSGSQSTNDSNSDTLILLTSKSAAFESDILAQDKIRRKKLAPISALIGVIAGAAIVLSSTLGGVQSPATSAAFDLSRSTLASTQQTPLTTATNKASKNLKTTPDPKIQPETSLRPLITPKFISDLPVQGEWVWPSKSTTITSPFGYRLDPFTSAAAFHSGLDLAAACGTPVYATRSGKVSFAGTQSGYGNRVELDHGEGYETSYSHLQSIAVKVGDELRQGQYLGDAGTTGRSTGCHLHFEIIFNGQFTDPLPFLKGAKAPPNSPGSYGTSRASQSTNTQNNSSAPTPNEHMLCLAQGTKENATESGGWINAAENMLIECEIPQEIQTPIASNMSPSTAGSPSITIDLTPSDSSSATPSVKVCRSNETLEPDIEDPCEKYGSVEEAEQAEIFGCLCDNSTNTPNSSVSNPASSTSPTPNADPDTVQAP